MNSWIIAFFIVVVILVIDIACAIQARESYEKGYLEGYKDAKGGLPSDYAYLSRSVGQ